MRYESRLREKSKEIIILEPIDKSFFNTPEYKYWVKDLEVNEYSSLCRFPVTEKETRDIMEQIENRKSIYWNIYHKENDDAYTWLVGVISLLEIDLFNRSAELALKIGEKPYWKRNIGFMACRQIINHGFTRLNLHRIYLGTVSENKGMIALADKLGMFHEGTFKDAFHSNGRFYNVERYAIIY